MGINCCGCLKVKRFDSWGDVRKLPATLFHVTNPYPKVTLISRQFSLDFPFAFGLPEVSALFRVEYEDFKVDEILGFQFSGEGEHLCLHIEKRGENTRWVAKLLAEHFDVDEMAIGYCGLKDRRAVTRQWFSVHLPNTPDASVPNMKTPEFQVLESCRHHKKLRRGMHRANSFVIRLRQVQGERDELEARLRRVAEQGVPNYFGEQRFGIDGGNLTKADHLLRAQYGADRKPDQGKKGSGKKRGRGKRGSPRGGIYLSAARSYLFNLVLAERVRQSEWACFVEEEASTAAIAGTGPMWGRGRSNATESVREFEQSVLSDWQDWTNALEFSGLQQERRSLVLNPEGLSWHWLINKEISSEESPCKEQYSKEGSTQDLELTFTLPTGTFATSILRELCRLETPGL